MNIVNIYRPKRRPKLFWSCPDCGVSNYLESRACVICAHEASEAHVNYKFRKQPFKTPNQFSVDSEFDDFPSDHLIASAIAFDLRSISKIPHIRSYALIWKEGKKFNYAVDVENVHSLRFARVGWHDAPIGRDTMLAACDLAGICLSAAEIEDFKRVPELDVTCVLTGKTFLKNQP